MARRSILYQLYLCLLDELNSGARSLKVHCGHTNHISNTVQFVSGSCTYFSIALVSACRNRGHLNHSLSSSSWEYCKHSWNVLYPHSSWYCRWVPDSPSCPRWYQSQNHYPQTLKSAPARILRMPGSSSYPQLLWLDCGHKHRALWCSHMAALGMAKIATLSRWACGVQAFIHVPWQVPHT